MATELIGKIDTPPPKARMPDCLHATAKNGPTFVGSSVAMFPLKLLMKEMNFI